VRGEAEGGGEGGGEEGGVQCDELGVVGFEGDAGCVAWGGDFS
jgi:hypothetical protein